MKTATDPDDTDMTDNSSNQQVEKVKGKELPWAEFMHLSGPLFFLILPLAGNILANATFWTMKRDDSDFLEENGREALNFQVSITVYFVIAMIIGLVGLSSFHSWLIILIPVFIVALFDLICSLVAAWIAHKRKVFHYPLRMHFLKKRVD